MVDEGQLSHDAQENQTLESLVSPLTIVRGSFCRVHILIFILISAIIVFVELR